MHSIDPRTAQPFGASWPDTTADELDAICAAAAKAATSMRRKTTRERADMLEHMAAALEERRSDLVALADAETALGEPRLNGELTRTAFQLRFLAEAILSGDHHRATISPPTDSPMGPLPDLRRSVVPLGPIAVFAASNFPFAFSVPGGDTAAAIAAGCPVVVKVHPSHPALSAAVASALTDALDRAGAPAGTFAAVSGVETGARLVQHRAIAAVAFTGSLQGGRALFDLACARPDPIPFYGELGSLNPVVVTPAAARARGAGIGADWVASVTLGGGQFCTKPGLLLVPADGAAPVIEAIGTAVGSTPAAVLLNEPTHRRFGSGVERLTEHTTLVASSAADASTGFSASPVVVRTTVAAALQAPGVLDEIFGPVGIVLEYATLAEVDELLDHLGGTLTATIQGEDRDPDAPALVELAAGVAGRVIWNGYPTGVAVSPSMQHGGPWPASTAPRDTSVGTASIERFVRPVSYQNLPEPLRPPELRTP
jgi:NADP-dependent aldehyde dehydrogenase